MMKWSPPSLLLVLVLPLILVSEVAVHVSSFTVVPRGTRSWGITLRHNKNVKNIGILLTLVQ
jgi:hypothetical protein